MVAVNRPVRFAGVRGNAVLLAQQFVGAVLDDGSVAVDATMGNGHDTLFLARRVGSRGRVLAFDIQQAALEVTGRKLEEAGLHESVTLILDGHQNMDRYLGGTTIDACLFNLGYLPGGDHNLTTRPQTTIQGLDAALQALKPGGRIGIVVYTGHLGAQKECRALQDMVSGLDPGEFGVLETRFANRTGHAPFLILIERVVARD